jgi:hypothetical protein
VTSSRSDDEIIADVEAVFAEGWCVCRSSSLPGDLLDLARRQRDRIAHLEAENARLEARISKGDTIVKRAAELAAVTPFSLQEATESLTWTTDVWRRFQEAEARLAAIDVHEVELLRGERDALAAVIAEANVTLTSAPRYWDENLAVWHVTEEAVLEVAAILATARTGDILRDRDATKWEQGFSDALHNPSWRDVPSRTSGFHRYGENHIGRKA